MHRLIPSPAENVGPKSCGTPAPPSTLLLLPVLAVLTVLLELVLMLVKQRKEILEMQLVLLVVAAVAWSLLQLLFCPLSNSHKTNSSSNNNKSSNNSKRAVVGAPLVGKSLMLNTVKEANERFLLQASPTVPAAAVFKLVSQRLPLPKSVEDFIKRLFNR
mmetsp:Transcript_1438/g.2399  ORF Transcript_1438/g.2399 Transcript_1438/m.2399 type:complete len:160 (+) Transcript_1438:3131-3610(+)